MHDRFLLLASGWFVTQFLAPRVYVLPGVTPPMNKRITR
jgi:hypothetical protein